MTGRAAGAVVLVLALVLAGGARAAGPVVVVDPGHDERANARTEPIGPGSSTRKIKDGGGTHGVVSGTREAELVLDVSLRLRSLLRRVGVSVVMTRTRTAGASMGNVARARIANDAGAALFLRVHADGHPSSAVRGTHILVPALRNGWTDDVYRASRRAASLVQPELVHALVLHRPRDLRAHGLHRLQLGGRTRDPRRARVHDESRRGPGARAARRPTASRARALPRHAEVPRPRAVALRGLDKAKVLG